MVQLFHTVSENCSRIVTEDTALPFIPLSGCFIKISGQPVYNILALYGLPMR